ncbi:N-acetylglucosaminyldiphosphodolichol N-acetylglucosaminyltransferase catalytic subunit alg13 [Blastocladiella emersonii ATCC 22665]|nr:N-acetylglucosaminyldiphosphodolichol N-acetylglucosaminyltransferase catalytic subunit alg13 [Blastocladiella emersonii ATCC 22665]
MNMSSRPRVFATVGTTRFAALVDQITSEAALAALFEHGYGSLTVQAGTTAASATAPSSPVRRGLPSVTIYDYKPTLAADMAEADLVVSHAGAGCVIEALRMGKRVVVVINEALMDNHQAELARALHRENYIVSCHPSELVDAIHAIHAVRLTPFPQQDTSRFPALLRETILFGN